MICPACQYMMDSFDKECPRCHGKGLAPPQPNVAPPHVAQSAAVPTTTAPTQTLPTQAQSTLPTRPDVAFLPDSSPSNGLQIAGGLLLGLGLLCSAYYFLFFDTSVAVPSVTFMGEEFGGGRVNNIGLMAQRQNGILIGIGMAVIGAVLFGIGQHQPQQDDFYAARGASAEPVAAKGDGELVMLYLLSALLPIGGIVLCLININKPKRAQAAAIGTAIGVVCGALIWFLVQGMK